MRLVALEFWLENFELFTFWWVVSGWRRFEIGFVEDGLFAGVVSRVLVEYNRGSG